MDLLRAFADAKLSQAVLVFAGDGPQREELEAQAARLGLQQRVRFLGFVNQSQLPAIYTSADVMVLPSIYEPFAVVVNEAMCCGCPVMVSDRVGAARDLVAPVRADFVFQAGDTAALTRTLQTALADPKALRETGRRGFDYVERNSPEKIVAATLEAVRKGVEVANRGK
jgi:glycosyltransferase involved in cell wall biosynthesis